jgi:uncharacterized protein YneF (UPF0154 family)
MKKPFVLIMIIIAGLIFGSIIGKIAGQWLPFLNVGETVTWQPKGDFAIIKYDFLVQVKLTLSSFLGMALGFWVSKKMK